MEPDKYISIAAFCQCHQIEHTFIDSLSEHGLLEVMIIEEEEFIDPDQVRELERMMRMHYELQINLEGIDAINHLLQKLSGLQNEVRTLRNRLNRYESE